MLSKNTDIKNSIAIVVTKDSRNKNFQYNTLTKYTHSACAGYASKILQLKLRELIWEGLHHQRQPTTCKRASNSFGFVVASKLNRLPCPEKKKWTQFIIKYYFLRSKERVCVWFLSGEIKVPASNLMHYYPTTHWLLLPRGNRRLKTNKHKCKQTGLRHYTPLFTYACIMWDHNNHLLYLFDYGILRCSCHMCKGLCNSIIRNYIIFYPR